MPLDVIASAADLLQARETTPPKIIVNRFRDTSLDTAYAVQLELTKLRLERGDIQIGYKVGCTTQTIQEQIGIHNPIFGRLFEQDKFISPYSVDRSNFDGLAIEGELAVELDRDPRDLPSSQNGVERAIARVFPVIELHHFNIASDALNAPVLVANNAIHAGFVQSHKPGATLLAKSRSLSIQLNDDKVINLPHEELERTIFDSLIWLRKELMLRDDTPRLTPPVTVLCGSVAELFRISKHVEVTVSFGEHEEVQCSVR